MTTNSIDLFITTINPDFENWDQLDWLLDTFKNWNSDSAEPPSSGAFLCASQANDLAAGAVAFFACAGDKHLPFEKCITQFRNKTFQQVINLPRPYGFGHPVLGYDYRVSNFFHEFKEELGLGKVEIGVSPLMQEAYGYTKNPSNLLCLNFAGLFGLWCVHNKLDERAAILPMISRLLGLSSNYEYNKKLPTSYDCIKNSSLSPQPEGKSFGSVHHNGPSIGLGNKLGQENPKD